LPFIQFPQIDNVSLTRGRNIVAGCTGKFKVYVDGGARNNPGIGGAGAALYRPDGKPLAYAALYCGKNVTNNYAEYIGVILGLLLAKTLGVQSLICHADSNLCVKQISGEYRCKSASLKPLLTIVKNLMQKIENCQVCWIPREDNAVADEYANEAMDGRGTNNFVRVAQ
jgi:ribonuclease HI